MLTGPAEPSGENLPCVGRVELVPFAYLLHPPSCPAHCLPAPPSQYSTMEHPVMHVLDASRAVVVASALLDKDAKRREEYVQVRPFDDEGREGLHDIGSAI